MRYPLELALRPSRRALTLLAAIHGVAAAAFFFSALPMWVRVTALGPIVASMTIAVRRERRMAGIVLVLRGDGSAVLRCGGREWVALPAEGCADFGSVMWLQLASAPQAPPLPRSARGLMLMPDSVPAAAWRGLRIWLRHKATATVAGVRDSTEA